MATLINQKVTVTVKNSIKFPYTIEKYEQTADFAVLNPEQCKFRKKIDATTLGMFQEVDRNPITYLKEFLRTK